MVFLKINKNLKAQILFASKAQFDLKAERTR
jgi:hypothetical protein